MSLLTRRGFLRRRAWRRVRSPVWRAACRCMAETRRTATDRGVAWAVGTSKVTRLAFGTGSFSGAGSAGQLGQDGFTRLVRYAYEQWDSVLRDGGVVWADAPDAWGWRLRVIPRESYQLMSKVTTRERGRSRMRSSMSCGAKAKTEYFDVMLLHWQHTSGLAGGVEALGGWDFGGAGEEDCDRARGFGAWVASAACDAGR